MTGTGRGYGPQPPDKRLIVNERGAFITPVNLTEAMNRSLLGEEAALPSEDARDFVYDDELSWRQPLSDIPIQPVRRSRAPARSRVEAADSSAPLRAKNQKAVPAKRRHVQKGGKGKEPRPWKAYLYVGIITASFLCMCVLVVMMMPQMAGYFWKDFGNYAFINGELLRYDRQNAALYKQYREYMARDVIYPGIFVDAVSVGDMTIDEARAALTAVGSDAATVYSVTVAIGDKTWTVDSTNVPATRDLGNVLERAYAIGRTNSTEILSTNQTPFRQRVDTAMALRESGINLTTQASYDHEAVRAIVDEITTYVTRDPIDAQIMSFDYKTRAFTFTEDQPGVTLDSQLLYDKITAALDRWERNVTVTVDPVITQAAVTKDTLAKSFTMVAAFTTDTTNESNRNTNIDLACRAINGTALQPGETFSFNEATGQRTTDKGYQSAGAIAAGQSIEEVGGGICQVSSTIFNAVARANLEIVSRSPHAWPSTYVNRGEDATVNWPNLDFKFKNNTSSPIFLITYYENRKMSAEIWGISLGEGVTIDLYSEVIKTMEPTTEINYVLNPNLPLGSSKTTVKPRTGYVVETYKVWYQNGQETKRELLHTSTYKAYQQVVEYN